MSIELKKELKIEATKDNFSIVSAFIEEFLESLEIPMKVMMQIEIAVEEIYVNIANYAYENIGMATIIIEKLNESNTIKIQFMDNGIPYDPLKKPDPDISLSAEERQIGGLGIFMVKKSMDNVEYEYRDNTNILTIFKKY